MNETLTPRRSPKIQKPHSTEGSSLIQSVIVVNTGQKTPVMKTRTQGLSNISPVNVGYSTSLLFGTELNADIPSFNLGISQEDPALVKPTNNLEPDLIKNSDIKPPDNLQPDTGNNTEAKRQPKKKSIAKKRVGFAHLNSKKRKVDVNTKQKEIIDDDDDDFVDEVPIRRSTSKVKFGKKKHKRN
ncbi:uncharacterized protein LOC129904916 [Solanum dulcamara]|uniref:uncharacterized protein LOC129904916 n=1 Tax=Solanum dulcamara TaxID=45834 RepID=UPI00248546F7|nr:uncharacterized protein LOC129904916 [Solanum dulcamara]